MTKKELSKEKEIRILEISLTPAFVALFSLVIYLFYIGTTGTELSDWFLLSSIISVIFGSLVVCLGLNELLLKIYGGKFKFKRLLFRWMLIGINFALLMSAYLSLSTFFPQATTFYHFLFSGLIDTGIFMLIIYKFGPLFNRLDTGEW
jgi:hypothetical protein